VLDHDVEAEFQSACDLAFGRFRLGAVARWRRQIGLDEGLIEVCSSEISFFLFCQWLESWVVRRQWHYDNEPHAPVPSCLRSWVARSGRSPGEPR
jgi:hypothetical protein